MPDWRGFLLSQRRSLLQTLLPTHINTVESARQVTPITPWVLSVLPLDSPSPDSRLASPGTRTKERVHHWVFSGLVTAVVARVEAKTELS
jgi:hypothetical protein